MGDVTKIALVRTASGRLDAVNRHVSIFTKKIEPRSRESLHGTVSVRLIERFQTSMLEILDQPFPNIFSLTDDHGIHVLFGF
jgi:hypothetical protein